MWNDQCKFNHNKTLFQTIITNVSLKITTSINNLVYYILNKYFPYGKYIYYIFVIMTRNKAPNYISSKQNYVNNTFKHFKLEIYPPSYDPGITRDWSGDPNSKVVKVSQLPY